MKSMTGYGSYKVSTTQMDLEVSIKTVNGRFFEFKPHMPREFLPLESQIKNMVRDKFSRGSIDIYVSRKYKAQGQDTKVDTNLSLAKAWTKSFNQLSKSMKVKATASPELAIANCPDILRVEEKPIINAKAKKTIIDTVKKAIASCEKEKNREGNALKKELLKQLTNLQKQVVTMEKTKLQAQKNLESRYRDRLKKLGMPEDVDPQRLAQEVVIQVDKADIQEEVTRLKEHMKAFKGLANRPDPVGKKLDFYTQELLREVNTIGSKSQISKLTASVVEAKSIVERIREQVQNVE